MRLTNTKTNESLVEFEGDEIIFHNKFLEQEMRTMGIVIPHGLRGKYYGKDCIRLGEEGFQEAFREVYYLTSIDPTLFHWSP